MTGKFTAYYENGNINEEKYYLNNTSIGDYKWYYKNGQLRLFVRKDKDNSLKEFYKFYHENGQLAKEGIKINAKKDGTWKEYSQDGKELKMSVYELGEFIKYLE